MIRFGVLNHVGREPSTLQATLASLLVANPMNAPQVFTDDGRWGASANLARALMTLSEGNHYNVCVIDDDVVLSVHTMNRITEAMMNLGDHAYSLWTIEQNIPHEDRERTGWVEVTPHMHLWGGAVVMGPELSRRVAGLIRDYVDAERSFNTKPDACLYRALQELGSKLYFHIPSLMDHAGLEASTIGNTHDHGETRGYKFAEQ